MIGYFTRREQRRPLNLALGAALALGACAPGVAQSALPQGAVAIARQGSFEAGGRFLGDPATSSLACDHGHVEYQIPADAKPTSVFLWHSSSAAVWQRTWDGGEGYQMKLLRAGYPTYVWDGPHVGRANWGCENHTYTAAAGRDQGNFGAWRFGPRFGEFHQGIQFPAGDAAALEQANRARYLEFDTVANAQMQTDAAAKAMDRIGSSVVLTNSAGGFRALLTRLKSDQVKGIVAYENPGYVFPESMEPKLKQGPFGPVYVSDAEFERLTQIPIQLVWGDYLEGSAGWEDFYNLSLQFQKAVNDRGGKVEVLKLTDAGLRGNTHIPFADLNNDEVAKLLFAWMEKHGF
jgi:hypothetical protein